MKKIALTIILAALITCMIPVSAAAMDRNSMSNSGQNINGHDENVWDEYSIEGDFNLAVGGTYEIPDYSRTYNYSRYEIKTVSGTAGNVVALDGNKIIGKGEGKVKIYFYGRDGKLAKDSTMKNDYVTINVRNIKATSSTKTVYISSENNKKGAQVAFKLNKDITSDKSQIEGVSKTGGYNAVQKIDFANDKIYTAARKSGTTKVKVNVEGKVLEFTLNVKTVEVTTENLVAYEGKSGDKIKLSASKPSGVTFKTSNAKIATVGSTTGKITYKGLGRCYIYTKVDGNTIGKTLIEVTYKKQYQAVQNAYKDMGSNLTYSQGNRMGAKYRDCSSFTSRCYYDESLGRTLYTIGPTSARNWSLTAAGQAKWLNDKGKKVATSKVSASKLLPGDLVFYRTEYKGLNPEWKHIDHVGMYVGNGMVCDTVTGRGIGVGTGGLDLRYYDEDDRVVFIGRPMA